MRRPNEVALLIWRSVCLFCRRRFKLSDWMESAATYLAIRQWHQADAQANAVNARRIRSNFQPTFHPATSIGVVAMISGRPAAKSRAARPKALKWSDAMCAATAA